MKSWELFHNLVEAFLCTFLKKIQSCNKSAITVAYDIDVKKRPLYDLVGIPL